MEPNMTDAPLAHQIAAVAHLLTDLLNKADAEGSGCPPHWASQRDLYGLAYRVHREAARAACCAAATEYDLDRVFNALLDNPDLDCKLGVMADAAAGNFDNFEG
jgi:hypothetical protein